MVTHPSAPMRLSGFALLLVAAAATAQPGPIWQTARIAPPPGADSRGGFGDAMGADGDWAVVSSQWERTLEVFRRLPDGRWRFFQRLQTDPVSTPSYYGDIAVDGDRFVVGTPTLGVTGLPPVEDRLTGAAFVFERGPEGWAQTAMIRPPPGTAYSFGRDVALDGDVLAVGAPRAADWAGEVHIYERVGGAWTLAATLGDPGGPSERFGGELEAAGGTIAASGGDPHAVVLFEKVEGAWKSVFRFRRPPATFLDGIAIDPGRAAVTVGAFRQNTELPPFSVHLLERRDGRWHRADTLAAGPEAESRFGGELAIEGGWIAASHLPAGPGLHGVYLFREGPGGWVRSYLRETPETDRIGVALEITDGRLLATAPYADIGDERWGWGVGALAVYDLSPEGPVLRSISGLAEAREGDRFGAMLAAHGDRAAIGVPGRAEVHVYARSTAGAWLAEAALPVSATDAMALGDALLAVGEPGRVRVFERSGSTWAEAPAIEGEPAEGFGRAVAVSGGRVLVGVPEAAVAVVFRRVPGAWVEEARLRPDSEGRRVGHAIALDGDTAVLGGPSPEADVGGALAVFRRGPSGWAPAATVLAASPTFGAAVAASGGLALVGVPGARRAAWVDLAAGRVVGTVAAPDGAAAFGARVALGGALGAVASDVGPVAVWPEGSAALVGRPGGVGPEAAFGSSFAAGARRLLVGAPSEPEGGVRVDPDAGAVYVFAPPMGVAAAPTPGAPPALSLGPNPARSRATLRVPLGRAAVVSVAVHDMLGRAVWSERRRHPAGTAEIALDVAALAPGAYVVRVAWGRRAGARLLTVVR